MPKRGMPSTRRRVPEQVTRLSIIIALAVAGLLTARQFMVPADFGLYGSFRASAVDEVVAQKRQYVGHQECATCHDEVAQKKSAGYHNLVSCEVCHGPGAAHIEDFTSGSLTAPRGRGFCPLCHEYLPSRPTGFPQIVAASHNPMVPCISCHEPHDPTPPETPKDCSACHATIARTKSVSHHAYVDCTRCHATPEQHNLQPRQFLPGKPVARTLCGECHADSAAGSKGVPQVDLATHHEGYVCWQCHYPHLPEAQ